ncbi:hypothetical protein DPMN_154881 [Dreissena polymorpha]|uniref:Uncharacterized protein n=1 Tax=Dreissena polymorpha TaxID=45954 RepID=A0A9D4FLC4_DREPO|nr:hypothetical protein DPMN_154881 [Dreissena polymorpha]
MFIVAASYSCSTNLFKPTVQLTQNQQILRSAEFDDINGSRSRLGIDHLVAESPRLFAETRRGTPRHDAEEIATNQPGIELIQFAMFGRTDRLTDGQTDRHTDRRTA